MKRIPLLHSRISRSEIQNEIGPRSLCQFQLAGSGLPSGGMRPAIAKRNGREALQRKLSRWQRRGGQTILQVAERHLRADHVLLQ